LPWTDWRQRSLFEPLALPWPVHNLAVEVWVGRDYIELENNPGAMVPVYEIVPFSEIVSVTHS